MSEKSQDLCCYSKHHKMEKFLEVCLMFLLRKETGHGYGLIEQLSCFGFSQERLNVSTLYRTLRKLEREGFVISEWEDGQQGPKKRVYKISENGKKELEARVQILKNRKKMIERLIEEYEQFT